MLQLAFVGVITDRYVDFSTAQRAALEMLGEDADPDERRARRCARCRCTRTSRPRSTALREGGLTLCSLTNSALEA